MLISHPLALLFVRSEQTHKYNNYRVAAYELKEWRIKTANILQEIP